METEIHAKTFDIGDFFTSSFKKVKQELKDVTTAIVGVSWERLVEAKDDVEELSDQFQGVKSDIEGTITEGQVLTKELSTARNQTEELGKESLNAFKSFDIDKGFTKIGQVAEVLESATDKTTKLGDTLGKTFTNAERFTENLVDKLNDFAADSNGGVLGPLAKQAAQCVSFVGKGVAQVGKLTAGMIDVGNTLSGTFSSIGSGFKEFGNRIGGTVTHIKGLKNEIMGTVAQGHALVNKLRGAGSQIKTLSGGFKSFGSVGDMVKSVNAVSAIGNVLAGASKGVSLFGNTVRATLQSAIGVTDEVANAADSLSESLAKDSDGGVLATAAKYAAITVRYVGKGLKLTDGIVGVAVKASDTFSDVAGKTSDTFTQVGSGIGLVSKTTQGIGNLFSKTLPNLLANPLSVSNYDAVGDGVTSTFGNLSDLGSTVSSVVDSGKSLGSAVTSGLSSIFSSAGALMGIGGEKEPAVSLEKTTSLEKQFASEKSLSSERPVISEKPLISAEAAGTAPANIANQTDQRSVVMNNKIEVVAAPGQDTLAIAEAVQDKMTPLFDNAMAPLPA